MQPLGMPGVSSLMSLINPVAKAIPGMATDFGQVNDHFTFSMIADSANSILAITEYK